jgi:YHS domain-containing protein
MASAAEKLAFHLTGLYYRLRGKPLTDLAVDPVCHMRVDPDKAATRQHNGAEFFFCSTRCARRFESEPGRYLA